MREQLTFRGTNEAIEGKKTQEIGILFVGVMSSYRSVNFRCCYSRGESGRKKIVKSRKRVLKLFKNYADTRIVH